MFISARSTMPALDYVTVIRSLYGDRRAMLAGAFASALAATLTAYETGSLALLGVAGLFVLIGLVRFAIMRAFWRADIASDDADAAEPWELRAVIIGSVLALIYGLWCFVSIAVVRHPFAELASVSLTIAVLVGICARNFGLDRLVSIQMAFVVAPMALGFVLHGSPNYLVLAALLIVMVGSFRKLAADIRTILLSAAHGRVEASRLAAELDMAMTTLEHGLLLLDEAGVVSVANSRSKSLLAQFGFSHVVGQNVADIIRRMARDGIMPRAAAERLLDLTGQRIPGKVLLGLSNGRYFEVTVSSQHDRSVLLLEDISERIASEERITFMARHDMLTGLANRAYFGELVDEDLEAASPSAMPALMLVDVDDFKHVNDTLGHLVGDELLMQVARRLRQALPSDAILARLGGDEFIVYRPAITSQADVEADASAILAAFATPFTIDSLALPVNVSLGVVAGREPQDRLEDLLTKADLALYAAKGNGKARFQVFHTQMDTDYHYRQRLKHDLREAVQRRQLTLAFQPLLDIASRQVVACEALVRWEHAELGMIAPSVFIPLAEETGLISQITEWVVNEAVLQCSQWSGHVGVTVNISARDFRGTDLVALVDAALDRTGLAADRLEVEVTETAVIEERQLASNVLAALAAKGVGIALDDFGTGYSSLSYLNALPFSKLKIDRSFVADIAQDSRSLRLLANVARLGRDLQLAVVAEGVETQAQLDVMMDHTEVQQVQGYLFSRPLPARDIAELIERLNGRGQLPLQRRLG